MTNLKTIDQNIFLLTFADSIAKTAFPPTGGFVVHILCLNGNLNFLFQETHFNVSKMDYVILPNILLASDFAESSDFKAIVMYFDEHLVNALSIQSNYGIIGHLSLLQNPVMKLSENDFKKCKEDLVRLKVRMEETSHLFYSELIQHLLIEHILDLYDIHARERQSDIVTEHHARLIRKFIELLYRGDFIEHRNLNYYAQKLFVSPHYLSEVCRKVSGKGASYFIDRFTMQEICRLLLKREYSLTEIADKLNFSSLSYFCRYVQKRIHMSPSAFRNQSLKTKTGGN